MKSIITCCVVMAIVSCSSNSGSIIDSYNNFRFDRKVIAKLPVYDSLANIIYQNISLFKRNTAEGDDYHAFRYMPGEKESDGFSQLPPVVAPLVNGQLALLDSSLLKGFDVFRDSSIKIYIRASEAGSIETVESLSFFPPGKNIKRREPPVKDTVLNERWLYWARFDKNGLF